MDMTWEHLILLSLSKKRPSNMFRHFQAGQSCRWFTTALKILLAIFASQNGKSIITFIIICSFNVCHCARTILHIPREWWLFIGCLSCQLTGKIFDSSTNLFTHFETFSDSWNVYGMPFMSRDRQSMYLTKRQICLLVFHYTLSFTEIC